MENVFFELAVIICLAAFLTVIFKILRQPLILAYIITGIIIGPFAVFNVGNKELLKVMGELGVTLLLFILGLELKISELKSIGKTALIAGVGQVVFTFVLSYFIALALGFTNVVSAYLGIAFTFSSTILVVKLISDKKDLGSLYGKISVGILLIQDLFAILVLIFLSGFSNSSSQVTSIYPFGFIIIKTIIIFSLVYYLSRDIFPKLVDSISRSNETLFLVSIASAFGMAAVLSSPVVGLSKEVGGLLAGIAMANSSASYQIVARTKSLRDFFITIFFVFLGTEMVFTNFTKIIIPAIIFSTLVLIAKPFLTMLFLGFEGYRKRTFFLTGITLAQISEFSLIIAFLGNKLGHLEVEIISLVTAVGIITFIISNYLIVHSHGLFKSISSYLSFFERGSHQKENIDGANDLTNHVVLIGAHRVGQHILDSLEKKGDNVCVVDFNPDVVKGLKEKDFVSIFGDISDLDIQEKANLEKAKLIISTVPDIEDNLNLIHEMNKKNRLCKIVVLSENSEDAKALYKAGADYVVLPHLAGSRQIARILKEDSYQTIKDLKEKDLDYLN